MNYFRYLCIICLLLVLTTNNVKSGVVKGVVKSQSAKPIKNAVVYIEKIEGKIFSPPEKSALMDQKNLAFVPHVLPVLAGTTVDFLNSDDVLHNVFTPDKCAEKFNLGSWPKGQKRSFTFDSPGCNSVVLCNVHPEMEAYILVLETPYYAASLETGEYQIDNVPPGKYNLQVWHKRLAGNDVEIIVPESGNIKADFKMGRKRR
jgi:plastocyanin